MMMYQDRTFDIDKMQSTMRHLHWDGLSRNSDTKSAGRGVAVTTASTCSHCGSKGTTPATAGKGRDSKFPGSHDKQNSSDYSKGKERLKDTDDRKWCSVHTTTSRSD